MGQAPWKLTHYRRLRRLKSREEVPLNWNKWVRQIHRWLSMAFTVAVTVNIVAVVQKKYTDRMGLLAVLPLALLLVTGLYLFVLPYATKWRSGRRTD
jgi:heme A synthase